ncbi:stage II sporulation protein R [Anaerovorax sp. IOR16]|uniref:stage II sporulation protein R n=1 Tax=Anaerovorax sp. IOR16 TaxID=2773458 RepID=UPI0019D1D8C6|nr:stage II sporulation protein R [Anaerovorax sp. IOR16]
MGLKKKQMQFLLLVLLCLFAYTTWNMQKRMNPSMSNEDFIRFHVIANSDTEEDQALKREVRDELLKKINEELVEEAIAQATEEAKEVSLTLNDSRDYIKNHLVDIEQAAESVIKKEGYTYKATAVLGNRWVPKKSYGNVTFPAGNYEALNISIGEGKGQNWWCVLFPPLCLIGAEVPEELDSDLVPVVPIDPKVAEIYREALTEDTYKELIEAATDPKRKPTTLKLKFKTLEMLNID